MENKTMENVILEEEQCNDEWYQPVLHCDKCACTFMWYAGSGFSEYPKFCPNCGKKFTHLRQGNTLQGIAECQ